MIIGTGGKGKLYRLEGDPLRPTLLARAAAQQVTAFYKDPGGRLYYATANPGKLFRLSPERATRGTYESDVRDAQMVSTWGTMSWRGTAAGGNKIELFTRAGNTETPDDTWSVWSSAYTNAVGIADHQPEGALSAVARGADRQGRRPGADVGDRRLPAAQSPAGGAQHHRPPPGIVFQKPFSTGDPELAGFDDQSTPERKLAAAASAQPGNASTLGRRTYQKGLQTLAWKADDENDDDLVYDVLFRREGEAVWKTLRKGTSDTILVWDTTTVPNGTYFVKIVASDAPSNPLSSALDRRARERGVRSRQHAADDHRRQPCASSVAAPIISFDVKDDHSPVQRVEFSQDGQRWRGVFPVDGIADSREEHYELAVDGELGDARFDAARQRLDEQRGDDPRRRAAAAVELRTSRT